MTSTHGSLRGLVLGLLLFTAAPVGAVPFSPGDTLALPGTTVSAEPQLAGSVLEFEIVPFSLPAIGGGTITGSIQQAVVRSDLDGTLDFYWQVSNDATSAGSIGQFRIGDFMASSFNANWMSVDPDEIGPSSGHRFDGIQANYFNYEFVATQLNPGRTSAALFMDTDALVYGRNVLMDVATAGSLTISGLSLAFGPAVPEPSTFVLALLGMVGLAVMARRKRG